ncbi:choice-of-anchor M domain-containing protein, partial [Tessaracoccus sp. OH4464_COT-324]|uniref:choice-of-anchor M domain-containing protein n=1 Tax=Tessaracoccus sp. OH4464_COT-324 TaxID=2491059 RepID=UPI0018F51482
MLLSKRMRSTLATLLVAGLGFSGVSIAGAEDTQLVVAKSAHVDSPKVFFTDGRFDLRSEFSRNTYPVDQTINYLSHRTGRVGPSHYLLEVGPTARELDFLGANTSWYMGPAVAGPRNAPIWAGFGADTDIPVEQFRDAVFTLDLVKVDGPGRVEMFSWAPGDDETPGHAGRMFSSSDPRYRSSILSPGMHTHNYTVFGKPGRYELTYRATARAKTGELLSSKDHTLRWQVGGNEPNMVLETSSSASKAEQPTFSIKPSTGALHELSVDLGRDVKGRAKFTVDGYHLAEVELVGGVAAFTEVLSAEVGNYQVTVVDESEDTLWTSATLAADGKSPGGTTTEAGEPSPKTPAASPAFAGTERSIPGDITAQVTVAPGEQNLDSKRITIEFSRAFHGSVDLASYEGGQRKSVALRHTVNATGEKTLSLIGYLDSWMEGSAVVLHLRPHPLVKNMAGIDIDLTDSYTPGETYTAQGTLVAEGGATGDKPGDEDDSGSGGAPGDEPAPPPSDQPRALVGGRKLLDDGHVDIAARLADGELRMVVKDDTRLYDKVSVDRAVEEVALGVPDAAKLMRRSALERPAWDAILAPVGEPTWVLPFSQQPGLVWPGYSTDSIDYAAVPGGLTLRLLDVSGPGRVVLFQEGILGGDPTVKLGSAEGQPREILIPDPTHAHVGWAFTKPGLYRLRLGYAKVSAPQTAAVDAASGELLVAVGPEGRAELEQLDSSKPGEPAPKPGEPAPKPGEPAPKPGEPAPKPGEPAPKPGEPAPKPGEPAPKPGEPAPKPGE